MDRSAIATAILRRAARSRNIDPHRFATDTDLESAVFRECVRRYVEEIKRRIETASEASYADVERGLRDELAKLSAAEAEAVRRSLGLDALSARAVLTLIKSSSSAAIAQTVVASFGFGSFLFLTTLIKAISLLFGVTFSFGVYTAATSGLAMLLSPTVVPVVGAVAGGAALVLTGRRLRDEMAKLVIIVGRGKLMSMSG